MSEENQLPVVSKKAPPTIDVSIPEELPTDAEMLQALQRQGMVGLSKHTVSDLKAIGAYIHGVGTVSVQRGRVMVSQQRLDGCMKLLYTKLQSLASSKKKKFNPVPDMVRVTHEIGYLTTRQVEAIELMLKLEGGKNALDSETLIDGVVKSFAPGAEVKSNPNVLFSREVHIHSSEHPATAK